MWARAVWIEQDKEEEGVIPEIWIQGQNCTLAHWFKCCECLVREERAIGKMA